MDALNFMTSDFLDLALSRSHPWKAVRTLEARVAEFAVAASKAGFRLIAVVDADTSSAEAGGKWRGRRERELKTEDRRIVLGADVFLTDALRECGVPVVRPLGADADDVLAALAASVSGGGVLSRDGDMFRYSPRLRVFDGWSISEEGVLVPTPASTDRAASSLANRSARQVDAQLAADALRELANEARASSAIRDKYLASAKGGHIRRGVSSSSDRRRGSLHALARPLRAAVYHRLGETMVHELLPEWIGNGVRWSETMVAGDASLDAHISDVVTAAAWLDAVDGDDAIDGAAFGKPWAGEELRWRAAERRFNRRALSAELVAAAAAPGDAAGGSLLALMRQFEDYADATPSAKQSRLRRVSTFADAHPSPSNQPPAVSMACSDCRTTFGISAGEVAFFEEKGFALPRRCKPCREKRKGGAR